MLGEQWWQGWRRWPRRQWKEQGTLLQPLAWSRRIRWPNRCVCLDFSRRSERRVASLSGAGRWSVVFCVHQWYEHRMLGVTLKKVQRKCILFITCILSDLHDLGPWVRLGMGLTVLKSLCKFGSRFEVWSSGDSELSSLWLGGSCRISVQLNRKTTVFPKNSGLKSSPQELQGQTKNLSFNSTIASSADEEQKQSCSSPLTG